jgi:phosphoadenosine phosphosulfate reductase
MTQALNQALAGLDLPSRIRTLRRTIAGQLVFTTSFGLEDQALTHAIVESGADIAFATLDTGRLFPETYTLWSGTEDRYGLRIRAYTPRHEALEDYIAEAGVSGFFRSIEARKACCHIRKVEPLSRALNGASGWITGLRADQSAARGDARFVEDNADYGLLKLNPLADWSREAVLSYAEAQGVPISPLHGRGFASIGCAPCTRAIAPGEPERAGRWWWEDEAKKECGLHVGPDGRVMPAVSGSQVRP